MSAINCGGWKANMPRADIDRGIGHTLTSRLDRRSQSPQAGSFVRRQLTSTTVKPPINWRSCASEVIWFNLLVVSITPIVSIYGLLTARIDARTAWFSLAYYIFNMLGTFPSRIDSCTCHSCRAIHSTGITAGEHGETSSADVECLLPDTRHRLPSLVVAPCVQGFQAPAIRPRGCGCGCRARFY